MISAMWKAWVIMTLKRNYINMLDSAISSHTEWKSLLTFWEAETSVWQTQLSVLCCLFLTPTYQNPSTTVSHGPYSPVTCNSLEPLDVPINHIFFHWNFLLNLTHSHLKPGDFNLHTQHWKTLYFFCETFPAALHCTTLCDLPVSASHPSGFSRGG